MVINTKSNPRVTYLDTNNFYGWVVNAVYGSNLKDLTYLKDFAQIINKCV